jgi:hypothetical protein
VELLTITVKEVIVRFVDTTNNHLFSSDGQQFHQYQQNEQSPLEQ